jgi:hypothetical protein
MVAAIMEKLTDFSADHEPKFMIAGIWGRR